MTQSPLRRTGRDVSTPTHEERFRTVYADAYDDVLRFVQRRIDPRHADSGHAEDVVAEAMLTAWRRVEDLPAELGDARAWLFGIARNCLLNATRSHRRQDALAVRIARTGSVAQGSTPDGADAVAQRLDLTLAWSGLSPTDQEALGLTVFDALTSDQAGAVLGISPVAYRVRLSRARAALRRRLQGADSHPGRTDTAPRPATGPSPADQAPKAGQTGQVSEEIRS